MTKHFFMIKCISIRKYIDDNTYVYFFVIMSVNIINIHCFMYVRIYFIFVNAFKTNIGIFLNILLSCLHGLHNAGSAIEALLDTTKKGKDERRRIAQASPPNGRPWRGGRLPRSPIWRTLAAAAGPPPNSGIRT